MRPELSDEERQEAMAYVDAVVSHAEGRREAPITLPERARAEPPLVTRVTPGFVKRAVVRSLRYVLRHPFAHLAHPLEVRLEEQIGEVRGIARSALRRAEQNTGELERLRKELERLRKELDRESRQPPA